MAFTFAGCNKLFDLNLRSRMLVSATDQIYIMSVVTEMNVHGTFVSSMGIVLED